MVTHLQNHRYETYVAVNHMIKTLPTQQCIIFIIVLHMSLPTTWNTLGSSECPVFLSDFNQIWIFWHIFIKVMNTKFHRNLSSRCHTDTCRQMDMMKLVYASQNYAHTTKYLLIARMCLLCKSIKYYDCVYIFALIIQHAECMFSALYYMACMDLPYFSTL
jgi:hypothetical protein